MISNTVNYKRASDLNLWLSCQEHDDLKAYAELFDRYIPKLHRIGNKYFNDSFLIEELTVDVLLNIWQRRKVIVIEKSISSYLFKAIHFQCLQYIRKKKLHFSDIDDIPENNLISYQACDYKLQTQELDHIYQQVLFRLSPQRRKVFELSRVNNMSYDQISQEMNISKSTVEGHMTAALKIFRKSFIELGFYSAVLILVIFFGG